MVSKSRDSKLFLSATFVALLLGVMISSHTTKSYQSTKVEAKQNTLYINESLIKITGQLSDAINEYNAPGENKEELRNGIIQTAAVRKQLFINHLNNDMPDPYRYILPDKIRTVIPYFLTEQNLVEKDIYVNGTIKQNEDNKLLFQPTLPDMPFSEYHVLSSRQLESYPGTIHAVALESYLFVK